MALLVPPGGAIIVDPARLSSFERAFMEANMGGGILLWLLGVPIPIIILLALIWH
jgi:hypothetical protein